MNSPLVWLVVIVLGFVMTFFLGYFIFYGIVTLINKKAPPAYKKKIAVIGGILFICLLLLIVLLNAPVFFPVIGLFVLLATPPAMYLVLRNKNKT